MTATPRKPNPRPKKSWFRLYFLHRYTGLAAAFFLILLSVTGILLNHTEALKLHQHNATSSWLLALYGIKSPDIDTAYVLTINNSDAWVMEFAGGIYLRDASLNCKPPLIGAMATDELIIISNPTQLCLFTHQGELIDYLPAPQNNTDNSINRLGLNKADKADKSGKPIIDTVRGRYTLNTDYTEWIATSKETLPTIDWKVSALPPSALTLSLKQAHKGEGLPWERVILDLHSGRIVGLAGVYFMDLIALLMIFLAVTGVMMWAKRRAGRKRNG